MKEVFKVIILFLIVFNIRMPIVYNSVFLAMGLVGVYYIIARSAIPYTYFTYKYILTVLIGTLMMAFIYFVYTVFHDQYQILFIKRFFIQFQMMGTAVFVLPFLIDDRPESDPFNLICMYISYTFALQGLIHLTGYLYTPFGEWVLSTKPPALQAEFNNPAKGLQRFRAYALTGSTFFELPCAYGIAFIAYMRLQLVEGQKYITGVMSYLVFFFLIIGITLAGRTGFVGVAIGIGFYCIFNADPINIIYTTAKKALIFIPFLLGIYFIALTPGQRKGFENDIFPFAFEMFYNLESKGKFSTGSTDATMAFYYPLRDETLIFGHGNDPQAVGFGYPFTDAGYMRMLIYGGVPLLIMVIIYQYLFFHLPLKYARERKNWLDFLMFLSLFFCILAYHIKDNALGMQHLTEVMFMLLGFTYLLSETENDNKERIIANYR